MHKTILTLLALTALAGCTTKPAPPHPVETAISDSAIDNPWFRDAQTALAKSLAMKPRPARATNVILFIGDGMSVDTVTAARILAGQQRGASGEENWLTFERLRHTAMIKTYNTDLQVPDSAGTATAMLSGVKTRASVIGVDETVGIGDCSTLESSRIETFLELMEKRGKSTGVVTTARLTHATPASAYAHSPSRNWELDREIPPDQRACVDIARQLVEFDSGDGIEVAMGGGRSGFQSLSIADPEYPDEYGLREDGRDLVAEWRERFGDRARFVWNRKQLNAIDIDATSNVLGLFERSHMKYDVDRQKDMDDPSVAEMTRTAIDVLNKNRAGYFLLVEGGRIDHAHHNGNAARALYDTIAFDDAIAAAIESVDLDETLIIVTADHGHTLNFGGYPVRGNPILGKVTSRPTVIAGAEPSTLDANGLPFTSLNYANGPGHKTDGDGKRPDLTHVDTTDVDYLQEAIIPLDSETHSGTDVVVYADGPGARLFRGVLEQNYIYHVMRQAVGEP